MLNGLRLKKDDNLLVGFETSDDAGVFKLPNGDLLVQTVDFITPVSDDPYTFGRIAALNSMSDVYAMGGSPVTALSVMSYNCSAGNDVVREMMQGAGDEISNAGCTLVGGHTVDDTDIKLGFSVTGLITDGKYYKNCGLREGDVLIYTKPIGIGVLTTALKFGNATEQEVDDVTKAMLISNKSASEILRNFDVSAVTDITGFGLCGHAFEMAHHSGFDISLQSENIRIINGVERLTEDFIIPGGLTMNMQYLEGKCEFKPMELNRHFAFFDPQTSGGLLIAVNENQADKMVTELKNLGYADASIIGTCSPSNKPKIKIL